MSSAAVPSSKAASSSVLVSSQKPKSTSSATSTGTNTVGGNEGGVAPPAQTSIGAANPGSTIYVPGVAMAGSIVMGLMVLA